MIADEIRDALMSMQDCSYRDFQAKLIPNVPAEALIGVRTPDIRRLAKQIVRREDLPLFLSRLPHVTFDENQLHALTLSEMRDYDSCIQEVERFLPYVDNWATCDQLSPRVFKKHRAKLLSRLRVWLDSPHPYTVRFAIGMLMQHYLDEDFDLEYPELVASVRSDEYYINMMIAWYFATALAKQYPLILPFLQQNRLSPWVHNKTIQKSVESYRITPEQKAELRLLRLSSRSSSR